MAQNVPNLSNIQADWASRPDPHPARRVLPRWMVEAGKTPPFVAGGHLPGLTTRPSQSPVPAGFFGSQGPLIAGFLPRL